MYCQASDVAEYVLQAYLDKIEELNPGLLTKNIVSVSGEIDDALRPIYKLPLLTVPETLKRICAVLAGYRSLGAITSLMDTSAGSANDLLYIQDMVKEARKDLGLIRDGKIDLGLPQLGEAQVSPGKMMVDTPEAYFDLEGF